MELSIIIPAYNCHNTINQTLESIVMQKLPIGFEVIIVNDCSEENYSKIVENYNNKINIREIKTYKNIGPGASRQFGIDNTESDYIVFIDGDDIFYDNNSIYKMYNEIKHKNKDLVICNFIHEHNRLTTIKKEDFSYLHGKIYKRKFLIDNNIRFNNTKSNEDIGFNTLISLLKPKVSYLNKIVYIYKDNPNSITRKEIRKYQFEGLEWLCYNINYAIEEATKKTKQVSNINNICLNTLISLYFHYLSLKEEYDVSKILTWAKCILKKYEQTKNKYTTKELNRIIQINKPFYEKHLSIKDYNINFSKFLNMINSSN